MLDWDARFLPVIVEPQNHSRARLVGGGVESASRPAGFLEKEEFFLISTLVI